MGQHQPFVDSLYKEMLGRIKQTDTSVPYKKGDYWYFTKTEEGKQYPTYLRGKAKDGSDAVVLLDQNEMAKGLKYFAISEFDVSDDGNILAFSTDSTGGRDFAGEPVYLCDGCGCGGRARRGGGCDGDASGRDEILR